VREFMDEHPRWTLAILIAIEWLTIRGFEAYERWKDSREVRG
jgi:hypothetical protein